MPSIIALTTDFGLADPFVGIMKGVIAGICPAAQVIDITHGIAAFSILDGALALWQSWRYFPADTIHVAVVDPGVGSERLPILAKLGSQWFIAPDNGLLTLVERDAHRSGAAVEFRRLDNPAYRLPIQSSTFHGRDIFAPAAAHLARRLAAGNAAAKTFGPVLYQTVQLPVPEPIHHPDGSVDGVILKADKFGNLLTNLSPGDLPKTNFTIELGPHRIERLVRNFAEAAPQETVAILGSSGLLEIAINRGSAQQATGAGAGTPLRLYPR